MKRVVKYSINIGGIPLFIIVASKYWDDSSSNSIQMRMKKVCFNSNFKVVINYINDIQ